MGKSLSNLDVFKQASVFNKMIISVFEKFIPYKTITCDSKDPPWIKTTEKTLSINI